MSPSTAQVAGRDATRPLERFRDELTLCTYCPSLCRHACPVSTAEGRDSTSPWGLMSLAGHVVSGRLRMTDEVAEYLYHCSGCRACTAACRHEVDVAGALVAARQVAVARGRSPFAAERFAHADAESGGWWCSGGSPHPRFRPQPSVLLLAGHPSLLGAAGPVETMLDLCGRLDEDELSCGEPSRLDVGHDLWSAGFRDEFASRARRVADALTGARHVVVMSPAALHTLRAVYPQVGVHIEAELVHTTEFLLPFLAGAVIDRVAGRVAYHDSCHLARHLGVVEAPREVLERVLAEPLIELPYRGRATWCCGGAGCLPDAAPDTSRAMSEAVVQSALEAGADRLVTFAPECLAALRHAAGSELQVDAGVTLVAEAVRGDGAL